MQKRIRFTAIWLLLGSFVIWFSMPAVFILAAVMAYYFYTAAGTKTYKNIWLLALIGAAWAGQFLVYYMVILKPQIHSEYLQNCHRPYFLNLQPFTLANWENNRNVAASVIGNAGGHWTLSMIFHIAMLLTGSVWLLRKHSAKAILLLAPLFLVYVAAFMHQYTLIPRVVLFAMPIMLILVAIGMDVALGRGILALNFIIVIISAICIVNYNHLELFVKKHHNEEMKLSMDFLQHHQVRGDQLIVDDLAGPAYIYYTEIHPDWQHRTSLTGGKIVKWDTDFNTLIPSMSERPAIVHSYIDNADQYNAIQSSMAVQYDLQASYDSLNAHVLIYKKK
jgi:hypothetical protein